VKVETRVVPDERLGLGGWGTEIQIKDDQQEKDQFKTLATMKKVPGGGILHGGVEKGAIIGT